ncbi:alkaline phosphatase family protein [Mesorhizobium sp. VK23B]|uniref:Alkaline phosphatase family protein n=1 Tax=Mesorhizobium dulcispinae TaxID=3072316 RepID=A0ABU4XQG4_9HYPH|nr:MULTISPECIES: alkaline phosphatase family protein [unclassified Mesorhizobium]MDX8470168.1 alkaline phosphatase family protein [Mesorhizobium sp. VK23B]MDX8476556.1 alkaline phosphatase family protein [Mesorhizobium sp. VK23A]
MSLTVNKFLIVSFDGLRPDLISPELTPNLCRLQSLGVTLLSHRTVYPSETRSAFPSLVTGATTGRHGMVGNQYVDRSVTPSRYIDTSNAVLLRKLDLESGGKLMSAATLGEILASGGLSLAVLATNTPGTTRFFHHKAENFGHVRLSGHFREACTADALAEAEARVGPLTPDPPKIEPDKAGQDWITSAFLEVVWPKYQPDVTILSYGEPDVTSHFHGTGAEATRAIIAHCDRQFGRVLDWWEAEGRAEGVQIIAISDHGHITGHTRVSVIDSLRDAGFRTGIEPAPEVDVVVVPGQVGALYLAEPTEEQIARLVASITEQPWCGPVFTQARNEIDGIAPGSLGNHLVFADHARAPDVSFSFRADDGVDPFGLIGGTFYDNDRRASLGVHGGLHPKELAAVGIVAGSAFPAAGSVSTVPSGICDFVPTILHLLEIGRPNTMSGRVLHELLRDPKGANAEIRREAFEAGLGRFRQVLRRVQVGEATYLESGTAEG